MRFLILIFYNFFLFGKLIIKDKQPEYFSMYLLSIFLSFNIWGIYGHLSCFFSNSSNSLFPSKWLILIIYFLIVAFIYFYFIKNNRFINISRNFKISSISEARSRFITIGYVLVSIILLFSLIWIEC